MSGSLATRVLVASQYLLPLHAISRSVYFFTRLRWAPIKNLIIRGFVRAYRPEMGDALETDPLRYASFNEFFTRPLRPGTRPLVRSPGAIASPVDGTVSEAGRIEGGRLLQAKGHHYRLEALLAGQHAWCERFRDGLFATVYLAPFNYHRIHMPLAGTLREAWYVPGRLFSVNRATAAAVPGLFARNERVNCLFEDAAGMPFALVLVGALNVGSISTVWHGEVTPRTPRRVSPLPPPASGASSLEAGAEMGRFNMGSTVILLLPRAAARWSAGLVAGRALRMGEQIGELAAAASGRGGAIAQVRA